MQVWNDFVPSLIYNILCLLWKNICVVYIFNTSFFSNFLFHLIVLPFYLLLGFLFSYLYIYLLFYPGFVFSLLQMDWFIILLPMCSILFEWIVLYKAAMFPLLTQVCFLCVIFPPDSCSRGTVSVSCSRSWLLCSRRHHPSGRWWLLLLA